jgi:hypothetical protein
MDPVAGTLRHLGSAQLIVVLPTDVVAVLQNIARARASNAHCGKSQRSFRISVDQDELN